MLRKTYSSSLGAVNCELRQFKKSTLCPCRRSFCYPPQLSKSKESSKPKAQYFPNKVTSLVLFVTNITFFKACWHFKTSVVSGVILSDSHLKTVNLQVSTYLSHCQLTTFLKWPVPDYLTPEADISSLSCLFFRKSYCQFTVIEYKIITFPFKMLSYLILHKKYSVSHSSLAQF